MPAKQTQALKKMLYVAGVLVCMAGVAFAYQYNLVKQNLNLQDEDFSLAVKRLEQVTQQLNEMQASLAQQPQGKECVKASCPTVEPIVVRERISLHAYQALYKLPKGENLSANLAEISKYYNISKLISYYKTHRLDYEYSNADLEQEILSMIGNLPKVPHYQFSKSKILGKAMDSGIFKVYSAEEIREVSRLKEQLRLLAYTIGGGNLRKALAIISTLPTNDLTLDQIENTLQVKLKVAELIQEIIDSLEP